MGAREQWLNSASQPLERPAAQAMSWLLQGGLSSPLVMAQLAYFDLVIGWFQFL